MKRWCGVVGVDTWFAAGYGDARFSGGGRKAERKLHEEEFVHDEALVRRRGSRHWIDGHNLEWSGRLEGELDLED